MWNGFRKMLTNIVSSRKFMVGVPILITLVCIGKISGEVFITGFIALFAANSYDKKKRMENGQSV